MGEITWSDLRKMAAEPSVQNNRVSKMIQNRINRLPIDTGDEDQNTPKPLSQNSKRISFPADSILNAVIQDGDVVDLLCMLKHNRSEIDINQRNHSGLTALHYAVLANNIDMAKLLLTNGANVHSQDVHGLSPLHTAAALGFLQMTSFLILFGADVFSYTKHSERPLDLAKDLSVIRLLYGEMSTKIQSAFYTRTMLKLIFAQILRVGSDLLLWILNVVLVTTTWIYNTLLRLSHFLPSRNVNYSGDEITPTYLVGQMTSECSQPFSRTEQLDKKQR